MKKKKGKKQLQKSSSRSEVPIDPHKENLRITISIALFASYLTIIYLFNTTINELYPEINMIIKGIIYGYFLLASVSLLIYLILKATTLKYKSPNNVGIVDIYIHPKWYKFFFDNAISLFLYSPAVIFFIFYLYFVPKRLQDWLILNSGQAFAVSIFVYAIILLVFWFLIDYFINYKIRGYQ